MSAIDIEKSVSSDSVIKSNRITIHKSKYGSNKSNVIEWAEKNGVDNVFVPEGRKVGSKYIHASKTVCNSLSEYLDYLDINNRKYSYYEYNNKLIPSHAVSLASFVRIYYPKKFEEMGNPYKVKFNTLKWDFRVFSKINHISKSRMFFTVSYKCTAALIGVKGIVGKTFYKRTGCSYTIKFNRKFKIWSLILYADDNLIESVEEIIRAMISSAEETNNVPLNIIPYLISIY